MFALVSGGHDLLLVGLDEQEGSAGPEVLDGLPCLSSCWIEVCEVI